MNALNLAALKRQLTTLSDEYSGLSPQAAAQIAADALEALEALEATEREREVPTPTPGCGCWRCFDAQHIAPLGYVLCPECGNKRCPHAADHRLACTRSNEPGQPGATRYPAASPAVQS